MRPIDEDVASVMAGRCRCGGSLASQVHDPDGNPVAVCDKCGRGWLVSSGADFTQTSWFFASTIDAWR